MTSHTPEAARSATGSFALTQMGRLWRLALDLVFPPRCVSCGRVDYDWCPDCMVQLTDVPLSVSVFTEAVAPLAGIASTAPHDGYLADAVYAIKYHGMPWLAEPLSARMVRALRDMEWSFDMIIPVPLHNERRRNRGYNQAYKLSIGIATAFDRPAIEAALYRTRSTPTQVGLSRAERLQNVAGAFTADADRVAGQSILLVDDVRTTGATLKACAQAMLDAGADMVYAVTVTYAPGDMN